MLIIFLTRLKLLISALKFDARFELNFIWRHSTYEMLDQILSLFEIIPDYGLNLMNSGQMLNDVTSSVLLDFKPILQSF